LPVSPNQSHPLPVSPSQSQPPKRKNNHPPQQKFFTLRSSFFTFFITFAPDLQTKLIIIMDDYPAETFRR
ncbi:MAG: hypothetical protein J6I52_12065, partial [Prevotella sp.]|nr:hypothetical protein [Prevotella sp.]